MPGRKILQIMPAENWAALFVEDGEDYLSPLAGWALVQDGTGTAVIGLVANERETSLCDSDPTFVRYVYLPDVISETLDELEEADDESPDDEPPPALRRPSRWN